MSTRIILVCWNNPSERGKLYTRFIHWYTRIVVITSSHLITMERPPEKPSESDCCGSGCNPCVFDVYEELLKKYEAQKVTPYPSNEKIRHDLLSPVKYKPFELLDTMRVNECTSVYVFKPVISDFDSNDDQTSPIFTTDNVIEGVLPYSPGQHVIMINVKSGRGDVFKTSPTSSISRCYTPVSVGHCAKNCEVRLLIKLYPAGLMSSFIRELRPPDVVYFRGPFGDFEHKRDSKYLMFCAGTGFAPMRPIIEMILADDRDETLVRLCFACATFDDILCRDEIRKFSKFWNFAAVIYLSKESRAAVEMHSKHDENIRSGKITLDVVREQFVEGFRMLICGSEKFNRDVRGFAEQCGCRDVFVFWAFKSGIHSQHGIASTANWNRWEGHHLPSLVSAS